MNNGRAHLRFDVISDNRQIFIGETLGPNWVTRDENGYVVDKGKARFQRAPRVKTRRCLRTYRQVINENLCAGVFQLRNDLFVRRFFFQRKECSKRVLVAHVRRVAVENTPHFYDCPGQINFLTEDFCAIWRS